MYTAKKNNIARTLLIYFAEKGKIPTFYEYKADSKRPWGYTPKYLFSYFGDWNRLLSYMKLHDPDLWDIVTNTKEETPQTPQDPLAALRASTTEK